LLRALAVVAVGLWTMLWGMGFVEVAPLGIG